jgi:plastocyanin
MHCDIILSKKINQKFMSKRAIYGIVVLVILIIIGVVMYMQSQNESGEAAQTQSTQSESTESTPDSNVEETTPTDPASSTDEGQYSGEDDIMSPEVTTHEITFSGTSYSPSTLTIKNGDVVVFKNNSDKNFWPASAMHPDHLIYPEFDAKQGVAPGETYQFKFTKTGAWGFHDHLTPSAFGKITVE